MKDGGPGLGVVKLTAMPLLSVPDKSVVLGPTCNFSVSFKIAIFAFAPFSFASSQAHEDFNYLATMADPLPLERLSPAHG